MYVFHVTVRVLPGREARYESWKIAEGDLLGSAPGFVKRLLLRDTTNPLTYHYISCWDSDQARLAFQNSPALQELLARHKPAETYDGKPLYSECAVIVDQMHGGA